MKPKHSHQSFILSKACLTCLLISVTVHWINAHKGEHSQCPMSHWSDELLAGPSRLTQVMTMDMIIPLGPPGGPISLSSWPFCAGKGLHYKSGSSILEDVIHVADEPEALSSPIHACHACVVVLLELK